MGIHQYVGAWEGEMCQKACVRVPVAYSNVWGPEQARHALSVRMYT